MKLALSLLLLLLVPAGLALSSSQVQNAWKLDDNTGSTATDSDGSSSLTLGSATNFDSSTKKQNGN